MLNYSTEESRAAGVKDWLEHCENDDLDNDKRLAIAAKMTEDMREAVYNDTGFRCSAGICHNKVTKLRVSVTILPSLVTSN